MNKNFLQKKEDYWQLLKKFQYYVYTIYFANWRFMELL